MNLSFGMMIGLKEIWAHKFRSLLTMLGVILGVASLLSMFSLTAGMARGMREYMAQMGGIELVGIVRQEPPAEQDPIAEISPGRTILDAEAIQRHAPLVSAVSPIASVDVANLVAGPNNYKVPVQGSWPDYLAVNKHVVERGRGITWLDVENAQRVCVVGTTVVEKLWPDRPGFNAVGETILINQRPFTIVGIFEFYEREEDKRRRELGVKTSEFSRSGRKRTTNNPWSPFARKNNTVLVPISTLFYEFKSANVVAKEDQGPDYRLESLQFQVADTTRFQETLGQVSNIVRSTHRGIEDFGFDTREEWFDNIENAVRNIRNSGGIIAGISLVVGGIGITNIMLASITERIREIGVRRAVGANGTDIFVQIVVESTIIGVIGGLLGLVASAGVIKLLVAISSNENRPAVELHDVLVSFGFAVLIGVLSGFYPALKASRLDPIEALRYG
jgi:putative ABC transport system permease protein